MRRKDFWFQNNQRDEQYVRRERGDRLDQLRAVVLGRGFLVEEVDLAGHENVGLDQIGRNVIQRLDDLWRRRALWDGDALVHVGGVQRQVIGWCDYDFRVFYVSGHNHARSNRLQGQRRGDGATPVQVNDR